MKLMKSWKVVTGQRLSCPIMNTTRLVEEKFCWHEICPKIDSWIFLDVVRIHNFHNSEMKIKTHRFLLPLLFSKTEHSQIHSIQYIQYILTWSSKSMIMGEGGAGWVRVGWIKMFNQNCGSWRLQEPCAPRISRRSQVQVARVANVCKCLAPPHEKRNKELFVVAPHCGSVEGF